MAKVAVISGGSQGLGRKIAEKLVSDYQVVILARDQEKLVQTAGELKCDFRVCDVSDSKQTDETIKDIVAKYGGIDILVNNAGIWIQGKLVDNNTEKIKQVVDVNTLGTIYLTRSVVPIMQKQKSGSIVNIVSGAGLYAKAERSVYNASKWAITGFTKALQQELLEYKIRVMGIYPALMNTELFKAAGINKDMARAMDPEEVAKIVHFSLSLKPETQIMGIEVKHIDY